MKLFNSSKAAKVALTASLMVVPALAFLDILFLAFVDLTIGLPPPPAPPTTIFCTLPTILSTGDNGYVKRDEHALATRALTNAVPKANFVVSNVERVATDVYKVIGNFETVDAVSLNLQLGPLLASIEIQNTGYGPGSIDLTTSADVRLDNIARFSFTFYVTAAKLPRDLCCLPDDLTLRFNWLRNPQSSILDIFASVFADVSVYSLENAIDNLERLSPFDPSNFLTKRDDQLFGEVELEKKDISLDLSLNLGLWATSDPVLPNFCWPCNCPSSSSFASSSTPVPSSTSSSDVTMLGSTSSSSSTFTGISFSFPNSNGGGAGDSTTPAAASSSSSTFTGISSSFPNGNGGGAGDSTSSGASESTTDPAGHSSTALATTTPSGATAAMSSGTSNGSTASSSSGSGSSFGSSSATGASWTNSVTGLTTFTVASTSDSAITLVPTGTSSATVTATDPGMSSTFDTVSHSGLSLGDLRSNFNSGPYTSTLSTSTDFGFGSGPAAGGTGIGSVSSLVTGHYHGSGSSESASLAAEAFTAVATKTNIVGTTIITITSCSDHYCTLIPVTTGVAVVKEELTSYITYCPLPMTEIALSKESKTEEGQEEVVVTSNTLTSAFHTSTVVTTITQVLHSSSLASKESHTVAPPATKYVGSSSASAHANATIALHFPTISTASQGAAGHLSVPLAAAVALLGGLMV